MNKLKHIIAAVIIMASTLNTFATDRIVEENGFGGAFTTIQAAINAAVANDRIIIYPRAGGAAYVENPSYTLTSQTGIQMLSAIETTRYKITGNVILYSGWQVIGAEVTGIIRSDGFGAATERVINCLVTGVASSGPAIFAGSSNTIMHIDNCTINSFAGAGYSGVNLLRGRVTGCTINVNGSGGYGVYVNSFVSSDTTVIAGNRVNFLTGSSSSSGINIAGASSSQYVHITNNFIICNATGVNGLTGIRMDYVRPAAGNARTIIHNNTVMIINASGSQGSGILIGTSGSGAGVVDVRNNMVSHFGTFGGAAYYRTAGSLNGITFQYNHFSGSATPVFSLNGVTPDATNIAASTSGINATTGALTAGNGVNGGDPTSTYLDLDLTANDVGCFGGSMSMANFNTVDNGSRVLYMNLPRTMFINQTLNIKADGVDK